MRIEKEGSYELDKNISFLQISCGNVEINGNGYSIKGGANIAIDILRGVGDIKIENLKVEGQSEGGIFICENSNITLKNIKISNVGYGEKGFGIMLYNSKNIIIEECVFSEIGINGNKNTYSSYCSALAFNNVNGVIINKLTVDGCVSKNLSLGLVSNNSSISMNDIFITDIFSLGTSKAFHINNSEIKVNIYLEASIISKISPEKIISYLISHGEEEVLKDIDMDREIFLSKVKHLKGVIDNSASLFDPLYEEHYWREFRTMERKVCHNSLKKSNTVKLCGEWLEKFCMEKLNTKIKVIEAFANLYENGEVELPLHRDKYEKWIIGLSFGESRTLQFVSDKDTDMIYSFLLEDGDIFIFSPDINECFQHRMLKEPHRNSKRINVTYFVDILEGKLI